MAVTGHGSPYAWLAYILSVGRTKPYIHYMFAHWDRYSKCSADCGWGTKSRSRVCQQVDLKSMQTLQTELDPQLCREANPGQDAEETSFCKVKDCSPCASGESSLGAFKYEMLRGTTVVKDETLPYNNIYRYPAASQNSCGDACGSVAGCSGFIWNDDACDLVIGPLVTDDGRTDMPLVNVGKLSEFCGQKFATDLVQVSKFAINLPGASARMKQLIDSIMQAEEENGSDEPAGVWRFRSNDGEGIFYSVIKYYDSEGDDLIPTTKMFVRQKPGSAASGRKRREAEEQQIPPIPEDVEVGEIGQTETKTDIVSGSGDVTGSCDSDDVCQCIDGYRLVGEKECDDIDECVEDADVCGGDLAGFCFNSVGAYTCVCNDGLLLILAKNVP